MKVAWSDGSLVEQKDSEWADHLAFASVLILVQLLVVMLAVMKAASMAG